MTSYTRWLEAVIVQGPVNQEVYGVSNPLLGSSRPLLIWKMSEIDFQALRTEKFIKDC